jgi:hypothetical protein
MPRAVQWSYGGRRFLWARYPCTPRIANVVTYSAEIEALKLQRVALTQKGRLKHTCFPGQPCAHFMTSGQGCLAQGSGSTIWGLGVGFKGLRFGIWILVLGFTILVLSLGVLRFW